MKKALTGMARSQDSNGRRSSTSELSENRGSDRLGGSALPQQDHLQSEDLCKGNAVSIGQKAQLILSRINEIVGHQEHSRKSKKGNKQKQSGGLVQRGKRTTRKERKSKKNMLIWLPKSLDLKALHKEHPTIEVDPAANRRRKKLGPQKVSLRDLKWIVGEIVYFSHMKRDHWNKWVNIPSSYWDEHTNGNYRDLIRWLVMYEVIRENSHYSSFEGNKYTKSYSLHPRFMNAPIVESHIKKKVTYEEKPLDDVSQHLNKWLQDPRLEVDYELTRQISSELDVHKQNSWKLNKRAYKDRKGGKRDKTSYRFHSVITRTPRLMRSAITFAGQNLVAVDIKNSQPFLFALKIRVAVEQGMLNSVLGMPSWNESGRMRGKREQNEHSSIMAVINDEVEIPEAIGVRKDDSQKGCGEGKNQECADESKKSVDETDVRSSCLNAYTESDTVKDLLLGDDLTYVPTKYTEERNDSVFCTETSSFVQNDVRGRSGCRPPIISTSDCHVDETTSICTNDCRADEQCGERTSENHVLENYELNEYEQVCTGIHWDGIPEDLILFIELSHAGLFYEGLTRLWHVERDTAKGVFWYILFGKHERRSKEERVFQKRFPNVYRAIKWAKNEGHNKLAIELQQMESHLVIDKACVFLMEHHPDVPIFTVHDSILTLPEHAALVERVIRDTFKHAYGAEPILKVKPWKSENIDVRLYEVGDEWYDWEDEEGDGLVALEEATWDRLNSTTEPFGATSALDDYPERKFTEDDDSECDGMQCQVELLTSSSSVHKNQTTTEAYNELDWRMWEAEADRYSDHQDDEPFLRKWSEECRRFDQLMISDAKRSGYMSQMTLFWRSRT